VDPDAVGVDFSAAVPHQRPAPSGRHRRQAAAPGRELELTVLEERDDHVDLDATDDPQVIGASPAGVVDVVTGDILEVARDRIEPEPPARVHVGEADRTTRREGPPARRDRGERVHANP